MIDTILFYLGHGFLYALAFLMAAAGAVGVFGLVKLAYGYTFGKYRRHDV